MTKTRVLNNIGLVSIALFVFLSLFSNLNIVNANGIGPIQRYNTNLTLREFSKIKNYVQNENSLNISLPSTSWTIQDVELNFTDITFGNETKIIEDKVYGGDYDSIFYQNIGDRFHGLAIQLKITDPTSLYGVELYGSKVERGPTIINVEIRGYDEINNNPNGTIYSSVEINITTTEGWHRQIFPSTLSLSEGNYFLVINGSNVVTVNDDRIWWYYNSIDPKEPSLYSSYYDENDQWSTGTQNKVLLHKLFQKVETPVFPELINMSVAIDDQHYLISNTTMEGEGYLGKTNVDFLPISENYQIVVSNNASESLLFNVSYTATLINNFISPSTVEIQEGTSIKWSTKPIIMRQPANYSVIIDYHSGWENITVLRNGVNITSSVLVDLVNYRIFLFNDSITTGADWEIVAYTPTFRPELNVLKTDYNLGQEIQFSLQSPILSGTYTFVLLDSAGIPIQNQTLNSPPDSIFSYNLSLSDLEGSYTAYVFWFSASETNAGVQTQEFLISSYQPPVTPPPEIPIPLIILSIVLGAATVGSISFIALKRVKSVRRTKLEKFLNKCTDISIINDVIVIDNKSGIDVFSQSFGGRNLDTSLISGFLQAISNFGSAISEAAKESRTLTIEYKDSIVMQTEFVNLKLIVTLKENPSANFKFIMEDLAYDIYKQYGQEIDKFTGILKPFHNMSELIEQHLNVSFLYPLTIAENIKVKLNTSEKDMVQKARKFTKESNFDYFYSLYLLPANTCTPKDYQTIFDLIEKKVFLTDKKDL